MEYSAGYNRTAQDGKPWPSGDSNVCRCLGLSFIPALRRQRPQVRILSGAPRVSSRSLTKRIAVATFRCWRVRQSGALTGFLPRRFRRVPAHGRAAPRPVYFDQPMISEFAWSSAYFLPRSGRLAAWASSSRSAQASLAMKSFCSASSAEETIAPCICSAGAVAADGRSVCSQ